MQRRRLASRVLLISPAQRLLLFKIQYQTGALAGMSYWATSGGQLRRGESFKAAAVRELKEETGVDVQSVGRCIAHREFPWQMPAGELVLAVENYFVVRTDSEDYSVVAWSDQERDAMGQMRWWSVVELENCREVVYPPDLVGLFREALNMSTD